MSARFSLGHSVRLTLHKKVGGCLISYNLQFACVRKLEVIWPDVRNAATIALNGPNYEWMNDILQRLWTHLGRFRAAPSKLSISEKLSIIFGVFRVFLDKIEFPDQKDNFCL